MNNPVLILSGTDFEYHKCDDVNEVLTALFRECEKFVKSGPWTSNCGATFTDDHAAVEWLFGHSLAEGDFGDICQIIKVNQEIPDDGEFSPAIWN